MEVLLVHGWLEFGTQTLARHTLLRNVYSQDNTDQGKLPLHLVLDLLHLSQARATRFRPATYVFSCLVCSCAIIDCPPILRLESGEDDKDCIVRAAIE